MKNWKLILTLLLFGGIFRVSSSAQTEFTVDFFYDQLDSHGKWFEMEGHGYVWQPREIGKDWTPYSDGRWVYTDAGWTWYSNEPYGWAVFHYGRWTQLRDRGWFWIPGAEWGPGWVAWRGNSNLIGWAPLPPEAHFSPKIGFGSWVDLYYDIGPGHYRFVEASHLGAPGLQKVFIDPHRNLTLFKDTKNLSEVTFRDGMIYNGGPDYEEQRRKSREPIPRYQLERRREIPQVMRRTDEDELRARVEGDILRVVDLSVGRSREGRPQKVGKTISHPDVERGWSGAGPPAEIAAARERIRSSVELPATLPAKPASPGQEPPHRPALEAVPGLPPAPRSPVSNKGKEGMKPGLGGSPPGGPIINIKENGSQTGKEMENQADVPTPSFEPKTSTKGPAEPGPESGRQSTEPAGPKIPRLPAPATGKGELPSAFEEKP